MSSIREFTPEDIPGLLRLYQRVWGDPAGTAPALASYILRLTFENPAADGEFPSLVSEESDGSIVGFLGVIPRRMTFSGEPIRAAVVHSLMVDPEIANRWTAFGLLKALFSLKQDLTIADAANDQSRSVWLGLGGIESPLLGLRWIRPLRPARGALQFLESKRPKLRALLRALTPLSWAADAVLTRLPPNRGLRNVSPGDDEDLDLDTLGEPIRRCSRMCKLAPVYDAPSLSWLFDLLAEKRYYGRLRKRRVRSADGETIGHYIYYANRGGMSQVLQIASLPDAVQPVLDALFADAWRQGSVAVSGRVEPRLLTALSENYSLFHASTHALFHSGRSEIIDAVLRGDAFLTRMEGEWWVAPLEFVAGSVMETPREETGPG